MNFIRATASFENGQTILSGSSFRIALPEERSDAAISGEVRVGVRPEELDGPCPSADNALNLKVAVKEHLGHTMLVYGYIGDAQIVASLDPHSEVEVGADIYLGVNTETLHVFDRESEEMLT